MPEMQQRELFILQVVATTAGILSAMGSSYIIGNYSFMPEKKNLSDKFIFVLSVMDLMSSMAYAVGRMGTAYSKICYIQGLFIQLFALGTVLWNGWYDILV